MTNATVTLIIENANFKRTFKGEDIQADIKFGNKLDIQQKTQERIRENTLNIIVYCLYAEKML